MDTYIIHVSDHTSREKHIKDQLSKNNLSATFINEGDISDLTEDKLDRYFSGDLHDYTPQASCGYKHLSAMECLIHSSSEYALVLEDDIIFYENAIALLDQIQAEIRAKQLHNYIISLEDSTLKYIKKSIRVAGQILYPEMDMRLAGAYIIDRSAAKNVVHHAKNNKCSVPIDWYMSARSKEKLIQIYWSQPTLAVQGSLNGDIKSLIDNKSVGWYRIFSFKLQRIYKRLLYQLR